MRKSLEHHSHNEKTPVALEGIPFILIGSGLTIASYLIGWSIATILLGLITFFIIWFFRNPEREIPSGEGIIVAPADGKIIEIKEVVEERILKAKSLKISIFMNVFNVHVNRVPYTGRISGIFYNKGKFMSADRDKASLENEQNAILMEIPEDKRILFIQIAGLIARRIACWVKEGDEVKRGQRFGLIRFGSRVDIYLPLEVKLHVTLGDKTKSGSTILGILK